MTPSEPDPLREMVEAAERGDEAAALAAIRRGYSAFLSGRVGLDSEAVDPNLVWEPPAHAPTAGTYRGAARAEAEVSAWREPFDDFRWEPTEVILGDDQFVVRGDMSGRGGASGTAVEQEEYHVWSVREGRIVRMQMFLNRAEALAAAGLESGEPARD